MKRISYTYPISEFPGSGSYFTEKTLLLDIETTGLSPKNTGIYMIGTGKRVGDEVIITLLFAENLLQEEMIISTFMDEISQFDEVVTFNGERFDLPFIRERAERYDIFTEAMDRLSSIDLLLAIRPYKKLLGLPNCRQKTVEALLNVGREDEYDGGALIEVYLRYENEPDPEAERLLVLHNAEDVAGMAHILPVLAYSRLVSSHMTVEQAQWDEDEEYLTVRLSSDIDLPAPITINEGSCYIIIDKNTIRAALPVYSGILKYFYPYPAKYVYLTKEQTVVPKVLASSIPSSEKRPAKAAECFAAADGDFISIDPVIRRKNPMFFDGTKLFLKDYNDKDAIYIKTDRTALNADSIQSYIGLLIRHYVR